MYRFVILALAVAAVSASSASDACPDVTSVDNFDFESYAKGTWYEVARYPNSAEKGAECGWAEYTPQGAVAKVKNYHLLKNKIKVIEGTHKAASEPGKIIVSLPYGANGAITDTTLNVLKFRKDDYLVGYFCKFNEATKTRHEFSWVLSRSKTLSAGDKADIDQFVKESKVLDSTRYVWPSFSKNDCKLDV